jgi:hypothetical protein
MSTNPEQDKPKSPAQELRERRHQLAAESGAEHFPSDLRYEIALEGLERSIAANPGKGILDIMDGLSKLYEYQHLIRNDSAYRHGELMAEIADSIEKSRIALLDIEGKLTPTDRQLASIVLSLTLSHEYLRRFHEFAANREGNFGLAQHHVRMAIEKVVSAFMAPPADTPPVEG